MSPENARDVWILPEKLAVSGTRPRVSAVPSARGARKARRVRIPPESARCPERLRCPNPRSVLIPPGNAVAAIYPTMRYTALRTAVS